jgi:hypothetical protein
LKVTDLIKDSHVIALVNEVKFIGDSAIFFWPLVDGLVSAFPEKKFLVYHPYENIFISPSSNLVCYGAEETFIKEVCLYDTNTTLVVAFVSKPTGIVSTLIQKEFKGLYKGFVGLDFWTFNLPVISFDTNIIFSREIQGENDNKYHFTVANSILVTSAKRASFPEIGIPYESAYKVLSFDTGFVHLSYVLSDNVLSIGGQSFFWHYPGQNYVSTNYYDAQGEFIQYKFDQSMYKIVDWLKE